MICSKWYKIESLKLQRNTENYLYLRNNHSNPSVWHQSDKDEFFNTKVSIRNDFKTYDN